jgi:hypothetical protein
VSGSTSARGLGLAVAGVLAGSGVAGTATTSLSTSVPTPASLLGSAWAVTSSASAAGRAAVTRVRVGTTGFGRMLTVIASASFFDTWK